MAKRGSRGRGASRTKREPKAKSKKPKAASTEVEVVEEAGGEGVDGAILIITTVVLLAAILCVDAFRGAYGEGIFF
jgi:hypothetical protein